ncbi:hypothetical protein N9V19_01435 [Opitutales bacterium]|nr:hypothetical protein [Opitutales bacterium]
MIGAKYTKASLHYLLDAGIIESDRHFIIGHKSIGYRIAPAYRNKVRPWPLPEGKLKQKMLSIRQEKQAAKQLHQSVHKYLKQCLYRVTLAPSFQHYVNNFIGNPYNTRLILRNRLDDIETEYTDIITCSDRVYPGYGGIYAKMYFPEGLSSWQQIDKSEWRDVLVDGFFSYVDESSSGLVDVKFEGGRFLDFDNLKESSEIFYEVDEEGRKSYATFRWRIARALRQLDDNSSLKESIKEAFYKHHKFARSKYWDLAQKMKESTWAADDLIQVWANQNEIEVSLIKYAQGGRFDSKSVISAIKKASEQLNEAENFDIYAATENDINEIKSNIEDAIELQQWAINAFKTLNEAEDICFALAKKFQGLSEDEFFELLDREGINKPENPVYQTVNFDYPILKLFKDSARMVYTDFNGIFTIPEKTTGVFAMLENEDERFFWMLPIDRGTKEVRISLSSLTTQDPIHLIFPQ